MKQEILNFISDNPLLFWGLIIIILLTLIAHGVIKNIPKNRWKKEMEKPYMDSIQKETDFYKNN